MRIFLLVGLLFGLAPLSPPARADFGGNIGGYFGAGRMGQDADSSLGKRAIGSFNVQLMPGWRFLGRSLLFGVLGDYRFVAQLSNSPTDFSGSGYSIGPGAMFEGGPVKILFSYDLFEREQYTGPETTLSGKGFHLLFGYKFLPSTTIDLQFVSASFDSLSQPGLPEAPLALPIALWTFGFGISYGF